MDVLSLLFHFHAVRGGWLLGDLTDLESDRKAVRLGSGRQTRVAHVDGIFKLLVLLLSCLKGPVGY